ncbi:hypothetical protein D3C75_991270 [compost metagenome]
MLQDMPEQDRRLFRAEGILNLHILFLELSNGTGADIAHIPGKKTKGQYRAGQNPMLQHIRRGFHTNRAHTHAREQMQLDGEQVHQQNRQPE